MRIKIIADSTCDLPSNLVKQYDIQILPLNIIRGTESFKDGIEITPADIFEHADKTGEICSTSSINLLDYEEAFAKALMTHDTVICFTLASTMSSCYQNACAAANSMDSENIFVVDSLNLSCSYGLMVIEAAELAANGKTVETIMSHINKRRGALETSLIIDKLDFIRKGGRCSALSALGANILQIKPSIILKDGILHIGKKYRGNIAKSVLNYVDDRINGRSDIDISRAFIAYTAPIAPNVISAIFDRLKTIGFKEVYEAHAGSVISCHCGRSALGVLFSRKI